MNALVFYSCSKRLKICLPGSDLMFFFQFNFHGGGSYDIETSPLICSANYWTGFYVIGTSFVKEHVKYIVYKTQQPQWLNTRNVNQVSLFIFSYKATVKFVQCRFFLKHHNVEFRYYIILLLLLFFNYHFRNKSFYRMVQSIVLHLSFVSVLIQSILEQRKF